MVITFEKRMKNIFFHFFLFKRIYHFFFLRIRILFELAIRFVPSLMTNALSCYVRDKLPPCSLFLLILKIVLTFFPPSMNHCIELRRRRLIRAVRYWKCRLFFRKGKKVSVSLETGARFDYHELRREKATVSSATESYENKSNCECFESREKRLIEYGRTISRD